MRKLFIVTVAVLIIAALSTIQASAADQPGIVNQPRAIAPQTNTAPTVGNPSRLIKPPLGTVTTQPPKNGTSAQIHCGFNGTSHTAECSCTGDAECNEMFTNYCKEGGASSCDNGTGKCTCEMKL